MKETREPRRVTHQPTARSLFDPSRLTLARELRGCTQRELADRFPIEDPVSPAALSQFENRRARPSAKTLALLASALDVPIAFFDKRAADDTTPPAFFRSLRSVPVRERRRARALASMVWETAHGLERYVRLPDFDVPEHMLDPTAVPAEVDAAAQATRRAFGLADDVAPNMVRLLETHGVWVTRLRTDSHGIDAFSVPFEDHPVVVLGKDKDKRDRSRFDCAHELGHIVMHRHLLGDPDRDMEKQAHRFAAEFLMPSSAIAGELPTRLDWNTFISLKAKWQTSIGALVRRARDLNRISDHTYLHAIKTMRGRGWHIDEPGWIGPPEPPVLFIRAFEVAMQEAGADLNDVAETAGLPLDIVQLILDDAADLRPQVTL